MKVLMDYTHGNMRIIIYEAFHHALGTVWVTRKFIIAPSSNTKH